MWWGPRGGGPQVHGLTLHHPPPPGNGSRTSTLASVRTHYAILGVSPLATPPEIRTAYRSLILLHHPDRVNSFPSTSYDTAQRGFKVEEGSGSAEELNEAWEVLGDAHSREEYDQALQRAEATRIPSIPLPAYALVISLDLFTPHSSSSTTPELSGDDPAYYTYPCRCSSAYVITLDQLEDGVEVIQCGGCSERCLVEYEVEEDTDGAGDVSIHEEFTGGIG